MPKKSKREYLVGFLGDEQTRYGKNAEHYMTDIAPGDPRFVNCMTLYHARRKVRELGPGRAGIFKLTLVEERGEKRKWVK